MSRKIVLTSATLDVISAIGADFAQVVEDGDLTMIQTSVRRMIMPDQSVDENCDDLDVYFESKGYPPITDSDRKTLNDLRASAEGNPEMMVRKDKWLEEQAAQQAEMEAANPPPPPEEPASP